MSGSRGLIPAGSIFAFLDEHRARLFSAVMFEDMYPSAKGCPGMPPQTCAGRPPAGWARTTRRSIRRCSRTSAVSRPAPPAEPDVRRREGGREAHRRAQRLKPPWFRLTRWAMRSRSAASAAVGPQALPDPKGCPSPSHAAGSRRRDLSATADRPHCVTRCQSPLPGWGYPRAGGGGASAVMPTADARWLRETRLKDRAARHVMRGVRLLGARGSRGRTMKRRQTHALYSSARP